MVSGTIYLRARYYNSDLGRFTQEDPIRDGRNWYSYCDSNPVNAIDPSGYAARSCFSDETDYLDSPDMKKMGIGGGGQVRPILSAYDSTSYSTYMARSNVAMYDASLGGYYSGGISSATANPGYYFLYYQPTVGDDQIVSSGNQNTKDSDDKTNQRVYNAYIPEEKQILNHIFNNNKGHVLDSIENRNLLTETTLTENYLGVDSRGNSWYAKILSDGRQVWVEARGGKIWDGGINSIPRVWDAIYGLKNHKG